VLAAGRQDWTERKSAPGSAWRSMIPMRHNRLAPVNLGPTPVLENHHSSAVGVDGCLRGSAVLVSGHLSAARIRGQSAPLRWCAAGVGPLQQWRI